MVLPVFFSFLLLLHKPDPRTPPEGRPQCLDSPCHIPISVYRQEHTRGPLRHSEYPIHPHDLPPSDPVTSSESLGPAWGNHLFFFPPADLSEETSVHFLLQILFLY